MQARTRSRQHTKLATAKRDQERGKVSMGRAAAKRGSGNRGGGRWKPTSVGKNTDSL